MAKEPAVGGSSDCVELSPPRAMIHFLGGLLSRPSPDGLPVVLGLPGPCLPSLFPPLLLLFGLLMRRSFRGIDSNKLQAKFGLYLLQFARQ